MYRFYFPLRLHQRLGTLTSITGITAELMDCTTHTPTEICSVRSQVNTPEDNKMPLKSQLFISLCLWIRLWGQRESLIGSNKSLRARKTRRSLRRKLKNSKNCKSKKSRRQKWLVSSRSWRHRLALRPLWSRLVSSSRKSRKELWMLSSYPNLCLAMSINPVLPKSPKHLHKNQLHLCQLWKLQSLK